jgi:ATP-dependent protease ClpP protease subunit
MIKLAIDDVIASFGVSNAKIVEQLKQITPGEDIEIEINSPGGYVVECIAIFNTIREHAKSHSVSVFINGMAASAASVIAIAARTVNPEAVVKVSENSIYFIHNPVDFIFGDFRKMQKMADYLQRLAIMFANIYSGVSGQGNKKTIDAMDAETFYIGKEIQDAGFANNLEIINTNAKPTPESRAAMIANVEMSVAAAKKKIKEIENAEDFEKAAALLETAIQGGTPKNSGGSLSAGLTNQKPGEGTPAGGKVGKMTPEELLAQNPECYKAVFALGQNAERERVTSHLKLAEKSQSYETAAKFITEGASVSSESVQSEYLALAMSAQQNQKRIADNPNATQTADDTADDAQIMAAFEGGYAEKRKAS